MSRTATATIAFGALVLLTLLTWQVAESPWMLAAVASGKVLVIGAVFLELRFSRPVWGAVFLAAMALVLSVSAWLVSNAA